MTDRLPPSGASDGVDDLAHVLDAIGRPPVAEMPPDRGSSGRTHVFVLGDIVVKCDDRFGSNSMERERAALEHLASSGSRLPIPAPIAAGVLPDGRRWVVLTRLAGTPPPDALAAAHDVSPALAAQLGALIAELHATPAPPTFGTWTVHRDRTLEEEERRRLELITEMARNREIVTRREVDALHGLMLDALPAATARTTPILAHRDVQPRNVLVDRDQRITALLDFESCAGGDPAEDFRILGLDWTAPGFAAFTRAYHEAGGDLGSDGPERVAYHVLTWALVVFAYLGGIAPRYLPTARTAVERVRAGERPPLVAEPTRLADR